jgi:hypothetical protein
MSGNVASGVSEMSEKQSEKSEMSELVFASEMMRTRIAPPGSAASKGERVRAAARALRWKFSRARDVWYADERVSIHPSELRKIEELAGVRYGQQEVDEIGALIARADALLVGEGPDFRSTFVDALRAMVGALARSGTGGGVQ